MSGQMHNGFRQYSDEGSSPETLSEGIKRTAGSHPEERVSGELPRALVHIRRIKYSPAETVCQAFGLFCGIPFAGMAPCGPLYSLQRVYRRKGLDWSRPFGIGETMRYSSYGVCKFKSEVLHISSSVFHTVLLPTLIYRLWACLLSKLLYPENRKWFDRPKLREWRKSHRYLCRSQVRASGRRERHQLIAVRERRR